MQKTFQIFSPQYPEGYRRAQRTTKKSFVYLCVLCGLFFTACAAPTSTATPDTPTPDTISTSPVLIAEVLGGIPGNNNYDYIELTNPNDAAPFDLHGLTLWHQLSDGGDIESIYRWDAPTLIPPGGSYLLGRASEDYGLPVDAFIEAPLVPQRGGLQLRAKDNSPLYTLVWGAGPQSDFDAQPAPAMENGVALTLTGSEYLLNDAPRPQNTSFSTDINLTLNFPATVNPGEEFGAGIVIENAGALAVNDFTVQIPIPNEFEIIALPDDAEIASQPAFFGMDTLAETHQIVLLPITTLAASENVTAEITLKAPWTYLTVTTTNAAAASAAGALLAQSAPARTAVGGGAIPIGTARTLVDQKIVVEGIATMYTGGYFAGNGNTKFYIEDETGGLQVWIDDGEGDVNVALGDRVRVRGLLLLYRGTMELAPAPEGIEIIEQGSPETYYPPTPVSVGDAATESETLAGRLIQAQGTVARVEEFAYSHEIDLVDSDGHLAQIYVDKLTEINMQSIQSGEIYTITGVLEVTDDNARIYPRIQADLAKVYPPVLEIAINAPVNIRVGEAFTVTLTVTNHTPNILHNIVITASLPDFDLGVLEISDGGEQAGKIITWILDELDGEGTAASVASVSYQAKVDTSEAAVRLEPVLVAAPGVDSAQSTALDLFIGEQIPVWAIQGEGASSAYAGERVTTSGLVTGVFPELEGFWIQTLETDYNPLTSDGLFVYTNTLTPEVLPGDEVQVSGVVNEYYSHTELEITSLEDIVVLGTARALPPAEELNPPADEAAALAYYESLEGMFVKVTALAIVVAPSNRYGEYTLVRAEHGIERLWRGDESGIAIVVDDGSSGTHDDRSTMAYAVNSGDQVTNLIGPLAYTYGQYKLEPVTTPALQAAQNDLAVLTPLADDEFSLMTWNVENLFDFTDPHPSSPDMPGIEAYRTQIAKVANTIVAAGLPTVVGLQEVENIGILEDIAEHESIAEYGYLPVLIEGTDSRYIDVGYLVRGDKAMILHEEQFPAPEGLTSRPPLLVQAQIGDMKISILNNHFTSMSGGEAATEPRRVAQAAWNASVMGEILTDDESGLLAVMGDLNSFYDAPPIDTLRDAGLVHVFEELPPEARYTYIYEGRSQVLDHILVTPALMERLTRVEILHVNADYALPAPDDTSPLHKSDHDPVVAVFSLTP